MLTLFQVRNTVVLLPSSFNFSKTFAMLLLVASCVDRSLLVDTARDYSAKDFIRYVLQTRFIFNETKNLLVLSGCALDRIRTQSRCVTRAR